MTIAALALAVLAALIAAVLAAHVTFDEYRRIRRFDDVDHLVRSEKR